MSQDKLRVAEQLMKEKRYDAARALLQTMDGPQAKEWLRDLQILAPQKSRLVAPWMIALIGLLCLIVGFIGGLLFSPALVPAPNRTLQALLTPSAEAVATGQPLSFSSDQLGMNPQIGPVHFEAGRYRANVTTEGNLILTLDTGTGVCGDLIGSGRSLFNVLAGQGNQGEETIFAAQGCDAILRFNGAQKPWALTIERIGS